MRARARPPAVPGKVFAQSRVLSMGEEEKYVYESFWANIANDGLMNLISESVSSNQENKSDNRSVRSQRGGCVEKIFDGFLSSCAREKRPAGNDYIHMQ